MKGQGQQYFVFCTSENIVIAINFIEQCKWQNNEKTVLVIKIENFSSLLKSDMNLFGNLATPVETYANWPNFT